MSDKISKIEISTVRSRNIEILGESLNSKKISKEGLAKAGVNLDLLSLFVDIGIISQSGNLFEIVGNQSLKKPLGRDVQKKVLNFFSKEGFWKNLKPFINQDEKQQKQLAFNDWPSNYPGHKHLLLSLGLMEKSKNNRSKFIFSGDKSLLESDIWEKINSYIPQNYPLNKLLDKQKKQREDGAAAENFVLNFELDRLGGKPVMCISDRDTRAGFDILSFENENSEEHDRYIEVKSYVPPNPFYLTENELHKAQEYGNKYYLYLVNRLEMDNPGYYPEIIRDPAKSVLNSNNWMVREKVTYEIKRFNQI